MLLAALIGPATAQTTIFSEGFNDQQSPSLRLGGQFINNVDSMWGTLPGFQPGLATIAYWEQGDVMYDGVTQFPAKRVTFFGEERMAGQRPLGKPNHVPYRRRI